MGARNLRILTAVLSLYSYLGSSVKTFACDSMSDASMKMESSDELDINTPTRMHSNTLKVKEFDSESVNIEDIEELEVKVATPRSESSSSSDSSTSKAGNEKTNAKSACFACGALGCLGCASCFAATAGCSRGCAELTLEGVKSCVPLLCNGDTIVIGGYAAMDVAAIAAVIGCSPCICAGGALYLFSGFED